MALILLCLLVVLLLGGWLSRPPTLSAQEQAFSAPADAQAFIAEQERAESARFGIRPGAEKRIVWAHAAGERTEYAVVYLHGFSATRQEIAPVPEKIAAALGANLFETRLAAHGRERESLAGVKAEDWLRDGAEALAIGKSLGDKLVLIGTSTGATVALGMARSSDFKAVHSLVFISPNFGPAAPGADIALGPYGPQLTRVIAGAYHEWEAANDAQARYWTTRYPTATLVEMLRLVRLGVALAPEVDVPNALLIYSPRDDVVSVDKLLAGFDRLVAQRKKIHRVDEPDSLSPHVLAGDILAPGATEKTATLITDFVRGEAAAVAP